MKTKLICLFLIVCGCLPLAAQQKPIEKMDKEGIYLAPDKMPAFPGGMDALLKYLRENIKYPVEAQQKKVQGRVIIQFVVLEDGSLDKAKVARGVDPLLDAEALRVVGTMPKWIPGIEKGVPVKVRFTVPVMFSLNTPPPPAKQSRGFLLPIEEKISNRTLEGAWQLCAVEKEEHNYRVMLSPMVKILLADKTFINIFTGNTQVSAAVLTQGKYEVESDCTYIETIAGVLGQGYFKEGTKNQITFELLNDKLAKFTFMLPDREEPWVEYWFRIPKPGDAGFGGEPLMAN